VATRQSSTIIYPVLGSSWDLWFLRVAGHGLGNCFYTYFHALVLAEQSGAKLIAPPWFSLKIGPLLRGSASKRLYFRMFRALKHDIDGGAKILALLRRYRQRVIVRVGTIGAPVIQPGKLNFVVSDRFTFEGLHAHRNLIRERLVGIVKDPIPRDHAWGKGNYLAMHVRMGDFAEATNLNLVKRGEANLRIPLNWYLNLTKALRERHPEKPIYLFSDGDEASLRPLLDQGASFYRSGSDMTDLLMMSGASILVGSNSTYSRWAAFLGNMPSFWLETEVPMEKPSDPEVPVTLVPLDADPTALGKSP